MPHFRRLYGPLLVCLALAGCDAEWLEGRAAPSEYDPPVQSCPPSNSKNHADREASDRQCRADQADATVQNQQLIHDHGMSMPQPW